MILLILPGLYYSVGVAFFSWNLPWMHFGTIIEWLTIHNLDNTPDGEPRLWLESPDHSMSWFNNNNNKAIYTAQICCHYKCCCWQSFSSLNVVLILSRGINSTNRSKLQCCRPAHVEQFIAAPATSAFQASTENISIWELVNHGALWLFAVLRLRNTLTYLLTYLLTAVTVIQTKFVNVSNDDIVDGSPASTLALMWAVIQHWQVCPVSLQLSCLLTVHGRGYCSKLLQFNTVLYYGFITASRSMLSMLLLAL